MRAAIAVFAALVLVGLPGAAVAGQAKGEPELLGRAILAADAYQPGPPSGAFIAADNGVSPPFPGQPIPGFSAVLDAGHGRFWAMPDNGFGSKTNSGDFLLRVYLVRPEVKTRRGGSGEVEVLRFIQLRDPEGKVPFALYRSDRLLTGADFDLESVRRARDGGFWFGEEFGPFLLHTDAEGKMLEARSRSRASSRPRTRSWRIPTPGPSGPAAASRALPSASTASDSTRCWRGRSGMTLIRGGGS
jgi:hypothetical protein